MLDINFIRNNKKLIQNCMKNRDFNINLDEIIQLDENRRSVMQETQNLHAKQNVIAKTIGAIKAGKSEENTDLLIQESEKNKKQLVNLDEKDKQLQYKLMETLSKIPNILQESVPFGKNELDNVELKKYGIKKHFDFDCCYYFLSRQKFQSQLFV